MDLAKTPPRSPYAALGGMYWIPRLIDKCRAELAGTANGYIHQCPVDMRVYQFLGITPEAMLEAVGKASDDDAVLLWVRGSSHARTTAAIAEFNAMLSGVGPSTDDSRKRFKETVHKIAPGRNDIKTWFQLLDLEEGRLP